MSLGIDIGTRTVTFAELKESKGTAQLVNFGGLELPDGAVRDGEVINPDAVAQTVKEMISTAKVKDKKAWLGVSNQRTVVRQIDLPDMDDKALEAGLRYQVGDHIPIAIEDAEIDHHVLDRFEGPDGAKQVRLLIAAAHREAIQARIDVAKDAGLTTVGVDLDSFAVLRALVPAHKSGLFADDTPQVLIDLGAGITNILVHSKGVPVFVRMLVQGGDAITQAVMGATNDTYEVAEKTKRQTVLGKSDGPAAKVIADKADAIVAEIRKSVDFYRAQQGAVEPSAVVLTGGGSLMRGFKGRLEGALRVPVEIGNPLDNWPAKDSMPDEQLTMIGPSLTTAIGLAVGGLS